MPAYNAERSALKAEARNCLGVWTAVVGSRGSLLVMYYGEVVVALAELALIILYDVLAYTWLSCKGQQAELRYRGRSR